VDTYCPPQKTYLMLTTIHTYNDEAFKALQAGVPVEEIIDVEALPRINRIGVQEDYEEYVAELKDEITEQLRELY
jgi:V/A-type H+-transporting ATPase subunit A